MSEPSEGALKAAKAILEGTRYNAVLYHGQGEDKVWRWQYRDLKEVSEIIDTAIKEALANH